jgi:FkbM family methyltransferase
MAMSAEEKTVRLDEASAHTGAIPPISGEGAPLAGVQPHLLPEDEVRISYRFAFGVEPKAPDLGYHRTHASFEDMRRVFLNAPEFAANHGFDRQFGSRNIAVEVPPGLTMWLSLADMHVATGILAGDWEPIETRFVEGALGTGSVFWDIGAMFGWFALHAARLVGNRGCVVAFEPQALHHMLLRRNVLSNGFERIVQTYELALSDRSGIAQLRRDPPSGVGGASNLGNTWIDMHGSKDAASPVGIDAGIARLACLDDLSLERRPDLVKIDVEGAEFQVLKGAERSLRHYRPMILCELFPTQLRRVSGVDGAELLALVESWGYETWRFDASGTLVRWQPNDMPEGALGFTNVVFR